MSVKILELHGSATFQDQGRSGFQRYGVSSGGAMDKYALAEGQALLNNDSDAAALELQLGGGKFECLNDAWLATSGGVMEVFVGSRPISWRTSFKIKQGQILTIGKRLSGIYSYLHFMGGVDIPKVLGSRSTHRASGLGESPEAGTIIAPRYRTEIGQSSTLPEPEYFGSKTVRIMLGPQSGCFEKKDLQALVSREFAMTSNRNRMGARLETEAFRIKASHGRTLVSDPIIEGDIQVPADGIPTILLADCQPTGGYPRIATVIGADLMKVAQLQPGERFHFEFVSREKAIVEWRLLQARIADLAKHLKFLVRDPKMMSNLLQFNLVSGVISGE